MNYSRSCSCRNSPLFSRLARCLLGLILALYGASVSSVHAQFLLPPDYIVGKGDLNGDGKVNLTDVFLADILVANDGTFTPRQMIAADTNGDGSLSIWDQSLIRQAADYYASLLPPETPKANPNGNLIINRSAITDHMRNGIEISLGLDEKAQGVIGYSLQFSYPPALNPWIQSWQEYETSWFYDDQGNPNNYYGGGGANLNYRGRISRFFFLDLPLHGTHELMRFTATLKEGFPMPDPSLFQVVHAEAIGADGNPLPLGLISSQLGDNDVNGRVDVEDAILSLRMAVGTWPAAPQNDVNGDGANTPADTRKILEAALNGKSVHR